MGKFCTSCGKELEGGGEFCTGCGSTIITVPAMEPTSREVLPPKEKLISKGNLISSAIETLKSKGKKEIKDYAKKALTNATPAYGTAGELTLPQELIPIPAIADGEGLSTVLQSGLRGVLKGFKGTLRDKKRLVVVIALVFIWLVVNILAALNIFPLPVRLLSWLTAAQGTLLGGGVGKGLVAALLAQLIADQGMLKKVKSGLGQLGGIAKGGKGMTGQLLLGLSLALIVSNMMVSSNLQNTMVCIAAFLLSAKALTHNGFLRRLLNALLPKAQNTTITILMKGWTLGFALFAAISFLPGEGNGYALGILSLLAGGIVTVISRNKKEANVE